MVEQNLFSNPKRLIGIKPLIKLPKLSIFKKIVNKIFGFEDEDANLITMSDELDQCDLDVKFARLFNNSGGVFNYCASEKEALGILKKIAADEHFNHFFCADDILQKYLELIKKNYTNQLTSQTQVAFITCEQLIAHDAKIMLSFDNIRHYTPAQLPTNIVFMATVSQIVANLSEAMMKVKRRPGIKNLCSISGKNFSLGNENDQQKRIFLLLLED